MLFYQNIDPGKRLQNVPRLNFLLLQEQAQQQHIPSGNLIGLQLPDENGEVLYLDPNDPAAQMLLQEAGITLGEIAWLSQHNIFATIGLLNIPRS